MTRQDTHWYRDLVDRLASRAVRSYLSLLSPANPALRAELTRRLEVAPGEDDSVMAPPVFEARFGYPSADRTMGDLAADGLLHPDTVAWMDQPPQELREQRFPVERRPYVHQLRSWQTLGADEVRSLVVATGTGSGKTECFTVPLLDALAREAEGANEPIEGIRAIFLYPLNALINSQRERLSAWTRGAGGQIRYCLYNGETPEREQPAAQRRLTPERVLSRRALRRSPPPLLVTNATMLEYMLVRPEDREIIRKSRGRLRWIVLDEAHTYLGSNAAELTLLIRRVLEAFAVDPSEVRFVATSATISSGSEAESRRQLAAFLGAISGQPPENVEVVTAAQEIPPIPAEEELQRASVDELTCLEPRPRYDAMCREPRARGLRSQVVSGAKTVRELGRALGGMDDEEVLAMLDLGREARAPGGEPFLPLRAHLFLRTQPGVWVCSNPQCAGRAGTLLDDEQWRFGAVYTHEERVCARCDSRVYELALCSQCGGEYLEGSYMTMGDHFVFARSDRWAGGLPTVDAEDDGIVPGDDPDEEEAEDAAAVYRTAFLGVHPPLDPDAAERFDPATGRLGADGYPAELVGTIEGERHRCVRCGETERGRGALFRAARSGGEFVLGTAIPALMESMPEAEKAPGDKPFRGRRTLTFTDSRQGTARFAARAQGEAERVAVRGFLYHQVWSMCGGEGASDPAEQQELEELRANLVTTTIPVVRTALEARIAELEARAGGPASVPLSQLVARLAEESPDLRWIHDRRRAYGPFDLNRHQLAQLLVTREIARRPRRRSSLETLGLLRLEYPTLSDSLASAPRAWRTLGGTLDEWKDFVRLTLDFVVRSNSALQIPREFFRWMGTEIRTLDIVGPEEEAGRQRRRWPRWRGGQVPRLARLLVRAFELSPNAADTRDMVNDVLDEAWRVVRAGLARTQVGWRFDLLQRGALATTELVWRCPVTRTALSTTLRGHTPFQPPLGGVSRVDTRCTSVPMPEPLAVFGRTRDADGRPVASEEVSSWLESAPVTAVRRQGLWSEFTDRIVSDQRWFAVGEHSAQLSSEQLQRREKEFKEEKLNVLSCSTTMEMGVDIGRLSSVSMNNAPPGPANFLQRAGRAGRRDETAAVSLTVCRSRPHDEEVFANPTWPLRTPIHVTEVRLDSQAIVQRHVNAFLLGRFLGRAAGGERIHRLNCAWFLVGQPDEEAPVDRFVAELEVLEDGAEVDEPLERLLRGSAFEVSDETPVRERVREARHAVVALWAAFQRERDALVEERELIPERERDDSPAARAISLQLMRIEREYLLSFMASRQFLPGYGFPTGVVPFVTTTAEELRVATRRGQTRIDNRALMRGYPSRDLAAALREYAPGSDVVLDGRVYRSRGVTLNWHRPPEPGEAAPPELQAFKTVWKCRACGSGRSGTAWPVTCPECGEDRIDRHQYLEPAGFAVDLFEEAETDLSSRTWIPPEEPWIFAGAGEMTALGDPVRMRYRYSPHGEIVHLSGGEYGRGYSICLSCGRAASQVEQDVAPPELEGHRRLRGGGAPGQRDEDGRCEANAAEHLIRRNQWLGTAGFTDVLELHLLDGASGRPLRDRKVAVTLGVAIRNSLAAAIGVVTEEIGVAVQPSVALEGRCLAIVLYDRASGGAGFCGQASALMPRVLRDARAALQCPRECRTACHACLLDFYTQNQRSLLDRRAGLEFLTYRWFEATGEDSR